MIEAQIVNIDTGEVVHRVPIKGATSIDDSKVDRVESGLLRNMNHDQYFVRTVDTEAETTA